MKKNVVFALALIALMTGVLSAQTYDSESDFVVTKTGNAITIDQYIGKKTVVNIPPRIQNLPVTVVGGFNDQYSLTSITIPAGVTSIDSGAFMNCTSLTSITIPNSVTNIGEQAFNLCTKLTSITLPSSLTSIGRSAFINCAALTSITIPNKVTSIGSNAFRGCSVLTSVTFAGTIPSTGFNATNPFPGDLRDRFYYVNATNGNAGTYTRPDRDSTVWTRK